VHPWQKQRYILSQFTRLIAQHTLIDLGEIKGDWFAQQSIRTLSSHSPECPFDMKTALTILNTSCYRGIPGDLIALGPQLSCWLEETVVQDPFLTKCGLKVQKEVAGVFCPHPFQSQVKGGAYRYQEMLGCIWRERAEHVVAQDEQVMTLACLMQEDYKKDSCIDALIRLSGLDAKTWLKRLFQHVFIPLYHLMCRYGVGLVAHGQNITLVLKEHVPVGCTIKDFHGDLRLFEEVFPENERLPEPIRNTLTKLPARYLLHDLLTGNLVSTMRFISPKLKQSAVQEADFYAWLGEEVRRYQASFPQMASRFVLFDVLTDTIEKVCINQVRFKIGYSDSDERPLPALGTPMPNPLLAKAS